MTEFATKDKTYALDNGLRNRIKPGWQEMLKPAKGRLKAPLDPAGFVPAVMQAETDLFEFKGTMVNKRILEIGCNEGMRCQIMGKYEGATVHGIDVDEYTVNQSPDLNCWNPVDVDYVNETFHTMRTKIAKLFPLTKDKVTFETSDIVNYTPKNGQHDLIISWDTLEHLTDLPSAFNTMAKCLSSGDLSYHEYNPFFSINGGHSLCTLDFLYGHAILDKGDFERYIREIRPYEEKVDIYFYNKCLNRASMSDVRKGAEDAGFKVLHLDGVSSFGERTQSWTKRIKEEFLPEVNKVYPTVEVKDMLCNSVQLILEKT